MKSNEPDKVRPPYRGRLAPSPSGFLHLGHARTFWIAQQRAAAAGGILALRNEDLDRARCKPEFVAAMMEDLRWFGLKWQEGPDIGGSYGPYVQSERIELYRAALDRLRRGGYVYACTCSRSDIQSAARAPQGADDEWIYPGTCRSNAQVSNARFEEEAFGAADRGGRPSSSWRFRVNDGETVSFIDGRFGFQSFVAGKDFGDFVVWRNDGVPAYQLACVVDDAAMQITEVVRGADLLLSTARQLLLYRALGIDPPAFYHCDLVTDAEGTRLAKRHDALSLRTLRAAGADPRELRGNRSELEGGAPVPG